MPFSAFGPAVAFSALLVLSSPVAPAAVINGDFSTGDLSSWGVSAISGVIPPEPRIPLISVITAGGNTVAQFETGSFEIGPFVSTLDQSFLVPPTTGFLVFDLGLSSFEDTTGTGSSSFGDSFAATLTDGSVTSYLVLADHSGVTLDPFGQATGPVMFGVLPPGSPLQYRIIADVRSFAGEHVSLYFDITNEDDLRALTVRIDNVAVAAIPEPASYSLFLLAVGGAGAWLLIRRTLQLIS